tara:strand:+ start:227 stop:487 length:261 start_codon:yes stop_codon:yes gene_type:complete
VKKTVFLALKILFLLLLASTFVFGQETGKGKTKFYNFDDLLINGQYRKPQVLFTDARQKVKFEKLLKLKKDFLPELESTKKDPSLR